MNLCKGSLVAMIHGMNDVLFFCKDIGRKLPSGQSRWFAHTYIKLFYTAEFKWRPQKHTRIADWHLSKYKSDAARWQMTITHIALKQSGRNAMLKKIDICTYQIHNQCFNRKGSRKCVPDTYRAGYSRPSRLPFTSRFSLLLQNKWVWFPLWYLQTVLSVYIAYFP
jgi:hypothetical protein